MTNTDTLQNTSEPFPVPEQIVLSPNEVQYIRQLHQPIVEARLSIVAALNLLLTQHEVSGNWNLTQDCTTLIRNPDKAA